MVARARGRDHARRAVLTITLNRPDVLNALNRAVHAGIAARSSEAQDPVGPRRRDHRRRPRLLRRPGPPGVRERRGRRRREPARQLPPQRARDPRAREARDRRGQRRRRPAPGCRSRSRATLASPPTSASFVPAFIKIGLVPDSGGTWLVRRLLGTARAFEWLTTGRRLGGRRGARAGGSCRGRRRPTSWPSARRRSRSSSPRCRRGRSWQTKRLLDAAETVDVRGAARARGDDTGGARRRRRTSREGVAAFLEKREAAVHRRGRRVACTRFGSSSTTTCNGGG